MHHRRGIFRPKYVRTHDKKNISFKGSQSGNNRAKSEHSQVATGRCSVAGLVATPRPIAPHTSLRLGDLNRRGGREVAPVLRRKGRRNLFLEREEVRLDGRSQNCRGPLEGRIILQKPSPADRAMAAHRGLAVNTTAPRACYVVETLTLPVPSRSRESGRSSSSRSRRSRGQG